jgi:hypothetical protein
LQIKLDLELLKHQTTQSGWTWENKVDLGVLKQQTPQSGRALQIKLDLELLKHQTTQSIWIVKLEDHQPKTNILQTLVDTARKLLQTLGKDSLIQLSSRTYLQSNNRKLLFYQSKALLTSQGLILFDNQ